MTLLPPLPRVTPYRPRHAWPPPPTPNLRRDAAMLSARGRIQQRMNEMRCKDAR